MISPSSQSRGGRCFQPAIPMRLAWDTKTHRAAHFFDSQLSTFLSQLSPSRGLRTNSTYSREFHPHHYPRRSVNIQNFSIAREKPILFSAAKVTSPCKPKSQPRIFRNGLSMSLIHRTINQRKEKSPCVPQECQLSLQNENVLNFFIEC